jgi:3-isopropylmalate/(R)-2-methylmalate dehydratase small subunit
MTPDAPTPSDGNATRLRGRAWVFGDDVNTDLIVPGQYLSGGVELAAQHVLEGARPGFASLIESGDVIVGGKNFGSGSSREMAVLALKASGVSAVVARSFARIFFRNCINSGFPPVECGDAGSIREGDLVEIDLDAGTITVEGSALPLKANPIPPDIQAILRAGGLENYLASRSTS